jgi:hypothetical protein
VRSHPKETKAIAAARLKNDKVDAQRLALLLRGDLLPTVWIPPAAVREARDLVRHRVGLIWLRTQVRNRMLAMLAEPAAHPSEALADRPRPTGTADVGASCGANHPPRGLPGAAVGAGRSHPAPRHDPRPAVGARPPRSSAS